MAYSQNIEFYLPSPVMPVFKQIVKVAATSFDIASILKAENAALRAYDGRRPPCVGPKTIITKARVVDAAEMEEKKKIATKRAAQAELARERKKRRQELAERRVSII